MSRNLTRKRTFFELCGTVIDFPVPPQSVPRMRKADTPCAADQEKHVVVFAPWGVSLASLGNCSSDVRATSGSLCGIPTTCAAKKLT